MTDTIQKLKEQLHVLRETARYLLQQASAYGSEVHLPPDRRHSLHQTRASIAHCKTELRTRQVQVDDAPEDSAPPAANATEIGLDAARALLDQLPLEEIPERQGLPALSHTKQLRGSRHFLGRDEELRLLARQLKAGGTVVVTTGIGGMGKTQLAIEAMYRYGRYFAGGVFWLSFATPDGIPQEVAECAHEMGLVHPKEQPDQKELVRRTRRAWKSKLPRLLIFDNCDDHISVQADALLAEWLPEGLPEGSGCRVLVTSRHQGEWSPELDVQLLPLDVLARPDSITLLQHLVPRLSHDAASQIAQFLGDLPLALYLAGRYLRTQKRIAAETYLAKLRSPDLLEHPSLTGHKLAEQPTGRELHVARTFALSFDRLNPHNTGDILARQLLARAAYFAPGESFAQEWLEATVEVAGDAEAKQLARTDATNRLLALGLLEQDGDWLRLHRLLAAFAKQALRDDAALPAVEQIVNRVAYLANETGVPQAMLPVLPHLRHLVQQAAGREDQVAATLCNNLGFYLKTVGAYVEAQPMYERALAVCEQVLGSDHPDTASSLNNLAALHYAQEDYERALPLYERALAIRERVMGSDHPDTASSLNNLAALHYAQGDYERALPLYERALAIRERVMGRDHLDTAHSLNNLAELYRAQKAYKRALPLYERALTLFKRVLGSDHPQTATSLNNLAVLYANQGQFGSALPLLEQALRICQVRLGPQHPDTQSSQRSLAAMRRDAAMAVLLEAVRAALETQDGEALQQALQALPHEQAQALVVQLQAAGILDNSLEQFTPLLQAIAAIAQSDDRPRAAVEAALAQLEQRGFHLSAAVQALWGGQRDPAALTAGLDATDTALIGRALALLGHE